MSTITVECIMNETDIFRMKNALKLRNCYKKYFPSLTQVTHSKFKIVQIAGKGFDLSLS
jgi:hypothetical protein